MPTEPNMFEADDLATAIETLYKRMRGEGRIQGAMNPQARIWLPNEHEKRVCCKHALKHVSRYNPWGLYRHCKTAVHVANLYNVNVRTLKHAYHRFTEPQPNAQRPSAQRPRQTWTAGRPPKISEVEDFLASLRNTNQTKTRGTSDNAKTRRTNPQPDTR